MSFEPFMWATFCDDVRQEVGNKISYLGIYGPNLIVPSFPTTLVKLCCVFNVRVPASSPPRNVTFKLLRDEEVIFQADLAADILDRQAQESALNAPESHVLTISSITQIIGLPVTQRAMLKARGYVDGKELRGGALELLAAEAAPMH